MSLPDPTPAVPPSAIADSRAPLVGRLADALRSGRRRLKSAQVRFRDSQAQRRAGRSPIAAPKELATELGCPTNLMGDSAQMNMWLHKIVLKKIADNGGNVPKELLD